MLSGKKVLPMYYVFHAKYVPVGADSDSLDADDKEGYTALTLQWHADDDRVDTAQDLSIKNAQTLQVPPATPGPWRPIPFYKEQRWPPTGCSDH